jgi:histidine phosphotransfer protein HptB
LSTTPPLHADLKKRTRSEKKCRCEKKSQPREPGLANGGRRRPPHPGSRKLDAALPREQRGALRMSMEPINLRRFREVSMGDEEFMGELIDIYLEDMPLQLEALRVAVQSQDAAAAAATAHRLKGASGNMGADSLSALCHDLEISSRDNKLDQLPNLLEAIGTESGHVRKFLCAVKSRSRNKSQNLPDSPI